MATLYIFSGLPGVGKTTLSRELARQLGAVHLRIDTLEQALRDFCSIDVQGEGYCVAYRVAADNLRLGMSVVADCCNPIELTRTEWEGVARDNDCSYVNIEVVCTSTTEHRQRVETRISTVEGLKLPTWSEVEAREFHPWSKDRIKIDTAERLERDCLDELLHELSRPRG